MQIIPLFFLFFAAKVAVFLLKNKGCLVIFAFLEGFSRDSLVHSLRNKKTLSLS